MARRPAAATQRSLFPAPKPGLTLDRALRARGAEVVVGVDEVGRGPLAGPVVAGAVILCSGLRLPGLDDSKKLTPARRAHLDQLMRRAAGRSLFFGLGACSAAEIDACGIREATFEAMRRALCALEGAFGAGWRGGTVVVDGRDRIPDLAGVHQLPVVRADGRSRAVAAASVLAKVARDGELARAATRWPAYAFERHKGYGTRAHLAALRAHGPCPIHRRSFEPLKSWITRERTFER